MKIKKFDQNLECQDCGKITKVCDIELAHLCQHWLGLCSECLKVFIKKLSEVYKGRKVDVYCFGKYRLGLTDSEIREYLKLRSGNKKVGQLFRKFNQIAGVNTVSGTFEYNKAGTKVHVSLMYRSDVERFADVLFGATKRTYFD